MLMLTARAAPSIWATIKRELIEKGSFESFEDAKTELFDYIEVYYNRQRRHSALGYLSPENFEQIYNQKQLTNLQSKVSAIWGPPHPYITGGMQYDSYFYSYNSATNYYVRGVQYREPYIAKYNTSGALSWVIIAPDGYDESMAGISVKNNTAYVLGNFKEAINFGYQQIISTNNGYNGNLFIWRYTE